jgi:hypothetical protein
MGGDLLRSLNVKFGALADFDSAGLDLIAPLGQLHPGLRNHEEERSRFRSGAGLCCPDALCCKLVVIASIRHYATPLTDSTPQRVRIPTQRFCSLRLFFESQRLGTH